MTPTPEQTLAEFIHWRDSNGSVGFVDANRLAAACEALIERVRELEAEPKLERLLAYSRRAEQAEARVKELEDGLSNSLLCKRVAEERGRAEQAEAGAAQLREALQSLLNKVNAVTAPHRHWQPVGIDVLDALCNRQIEVEQALASTPTGSRVLERLRAAEACLEAVFTPGTITEHQQAAYDAWVRICSEADRD